MDEIEVVPRGLLEHSNAELLALVLERLRASGPSREKSLAVTKLHEALLWLDSAAVERLP